MKLFVRILLGSLCLAPVFAQIPPTTHIQILKAEDARSFGKPLEDLMASPNIEVRKRAALAAGRIGDDSAIPILTSVLEKDAADDVRAMAAFALGEIESIKAADAIIAALRKPASNKGAVTARVVEAAGKIAAANSKDEKSKQLLEAILLTLDSEDRNAANQNREVVLLGITAAGRAGTLDPKRNRPDDTDFIVAKFLKSNDARIRTDAANTLTRLRSKNANVVLRTMLIDDADPIARANAARALGAAEDKEAIDLAQQAAVGDDDLRVRVSAIRALGNLKDAKSGQYLVAYGEALLLKAKREGVRRGRPANLNELLEVVTAAGRLLQDSENERAIKLLTDIRVFDKHRSPETEIALASVAPKFYFENEIQGLNAIRTADPRAASAIFQGYGKVAGLEKKDEYKEIIQETNFRLLKVAEGWFWDEDKNRYARKRDRHVPEMLRAFAADKSGRLSGILQPMLDREKDVFIRATLAELLADQPKSRENIETLIVAFAKALETDRYENDAQLAILDALYKLDKKEAVGSLLRALNAADYLLRKKAFEMLEDKDLQKEFPEIATALNLARANRMDEVLPYGSEVMKVMSRSGTKLGQILNKDADYVRALARKNGSVKAVLTTEKGAFTIDFYPEEAPLTVDNFIKLARRGYFNGLEVHRVVPNFVMQDGDPRGDGNGGPGWSIRCEMNMLPYERGAIGMALSGKDTGGSQWFVTHSPQPHLDGGYTVFGRVSETDMKVVDSIVRGDKILSVMIFEGNSPQRPRGTEKRKRTK